uniref:Putative secreted protein n=1 Tax=Ixodes ricinus TaxID=34613 RepID=A0A6B0UC87_IXORI
MPAPLPLALSILLLSPAASSAFPGGVSCECCLSLAMDAPPTGRWPPVDFFAGTCPSPLTVSGRLSAQESSLRFGPSRGVHEPQTPPSEGQEDSRLCTSMSCRWARIK